MVPERAFLRASQNSAETNQLLLVGATAYLEGRMAERVPGAKWVNHTRFLERVMQENPRDIPTMHALYNRMLREGDHVIG